jgi:hypothetical protein
VMGYRLIAVLPMNPVAIRETWCHPDVQMGASKMGYG